MVLFPTLVSLSLPMNRDFKGVWIPRHIWCDTTLNWTHKLLLVEIDSLDTLDHCFASNKYFAEFLGLSKSRVSEVISELEKLGYIKVLLKYKGKSVEKRIITLTNKVVGLPNRGGQETEGGYSENSEDINTNININNKKFIVPTISEVEAYKIEVNAECSPIKFINYHQSRGWKVGRGSMKCWKSAFRTWEINHHEFKKEKANGRTGSVKATQNYLDINAQF